MDQNEKIEFLGGQVHALVGFAHAVITSHPNLAVLARHLDEIGKVNLATAETSAVPRRIRSWGGRYTEPVEGGCNQHVGTQDESQIARINRSSAFSMRE